MTTTHEAMRQLFRVQSGINQLRLPGIFPDYQAPIVRQRADGERELVMARRGMLRGASTSLWRIFNELEEARQVTTRLSAISNARPKRSSAEHYKPAVPFLASQSTPPVEPKVPFREAGIN